MDAVQAEMLQRITKVETTVDNMDEKLDNALNGRELAIEALASAKSAHLRLNEIQQAKELAEEANRKAETALLRLDKSDENQVWLKRTFYGAIITGFSASIVAAVWAGIQLAS
ncbi:MULTISPECIES: hemolysin XhlA family protein [Paenibacillus]|uniref:Uncharacterized protein n=2 Tax=Paenibacillus TaxID=44249 RepID=A0A920CGJ3_9BACL|nr:MULTISPECIES: hemolysin XhlA family protein [Paenibacillus]MBU5670240.1 hemolysin XhlA family protein [Paenibacillus brevis]GIO36868.1 hypothetical protein J41TS12_17290 [Paenibacillus antibioticophila]